jgi:cyclopropane fatty-acyl-phospholipid synthase-like methyltransferase
MQTKKRSQKVAQEHYDLGNGMYKKMLGETMQYTCAYWKRAKTLDEAQEQKLDLICRKLQLNKGEKVLELGCGWGGFAHFAATNYGVQVDAYNISKEQVEFARQRNKGLPVNIYLADYRDATGTYDKVAAIGLCEHVGYKNYPTLMKVAYRSLKKHGLFLLHSIASNTSTTPWKGCLSWRIGIISDRITTKPWSPGTITLINTGRYMKKSTVTNFTACGNTIFSPLPEHSGRVGHNSGKLSCQSMACRAAMNQSGDHNQGL